MRDQKQGALTQHRQEHFKKDVDLFVALTELCTLASSLASQPDDTRLAVGGEAMQEANQVYSYFKTVAKTTPGLKPIAEQLGERFQKLQPTASQRGSHLRDLL